MRPSSPAKPSQAISFLKRSAMVLVFASLCACRVETPGNDPDPDPTPDPTPTPTVTPTPTPTVTPTPTPTPTPSAAEELTMQVVETNAGIMRVATADAQSQAAALQSSVSTDTSDSTLASAEGALVSSQTAYLHAETSLYYDEDSAKIAKDVPSAATYDDVATNLDKTARHSPKKRSSAAATTASDAETLQAELQQLAKAWDPSDTTNFRNQVFIPAPAESVARIFQGVIAITESVLPAEISQSEPLSLERINGRLFVVKNLYDGKYVGLKGEFYDGPGLKHLIEKKDPAAAAEITAIIDKAISLAPTAANGGNFDAPALQYELEALTKYLAKSAKSLGYKVKRVER